MALQHQKRLFSLFGFLVWGDLGPLTMYKSKRGKIVAFAKTYPNKPPSERQLEHRALWSAASTAWNELSDPQRQQWHLAARRASLCMHGYDLWMHWSLTGDDSAITTLERQTSTTLFPP